jgi:hypothetical protein
VNFFYETLKAHLSTPGMTMRQGTIVDANLIEAPSSLYTRAQPEYAGATRTDRRSAIQRFTRPSRATSGIPACKSRQEWTKTLAEIIDALKVGQYGKGERGDELLEVLQRCRSRMEWIRKAKADCATS